MTKLNSNGGDDKVDELLKERYDLAKDRIVEICTETTVKPDFLDFFQNMAAFLEKTAVILERDEEKLSIEELQKENTELYKELFPQNYTHCYGNPAYAEEKLGEYGRAFTFLYAELRGAIAYAYEKKIWDYTVTAELFLEVYAAFENGELPSVKNVEDVLRSYVNDYCQDMMEQRIAEAVDPQLDFAVRIVMDSDLSDLRYLYRYGEYVSANEIGVAEFMNSLSQDEIDSMARTYTEGYRIGFINGRKDITKKKTVNIRYNLGFERMVRAAILQFREMGLEPVIYRHATHAVNKRGNAWIGFVGGNANPQYEYDHRQDQALFMDSDYVQRKLRSMQNAYEKYKDLAAVHGGPACIETFGEEPFAPVSTEGAWALNEAQQKMQVELDNESGQIVNRYIRGDERSFTIIAYPVPEIGEKYEEIFDEIIRINTLDAKLYEKVQQTLIDALDQGEYVHILGTNGNRTDLNVQLHPLNDPKKETIFENCVADVNIPVGEVFTSPVLEGTNGVLHVSKVYLNELQYRDLEITFSNGMVSEYNCANFERELENKAYIHDNVLYKHPTLPLGEFAIGTNTTAYVTAKKYGIEDKMPILIAEKMGPHFAVGDTCYSWCEDIKVYNPNGKEIIARDNSVSIRRKEDVSKAYFHCHTDITIPYEELGSITVITKDKKEITLLKNGKFVLPGTEILNEPLKNSNK